MNTRAASRIVGSAATSPGGAACTSGASYDALEALTNAIVGLVISWAATFFVLGFDASQSAAITAMFFALSFTRAWVLRRVFRRLS